MGKKIIISELQFKKIIDNDNLNESIILSEEQIKIDNFDKVSKILDINNSNDFHFVQIIKRFKDNPYDNKTVGNYYSGAWYLNSYRIHSPQELMNLKPQIINDCEQNNARAYISLNNRQETETNDFIKIYKSKFQPSDARYVNANDIIPGQAKSGLSWKDKRLRLFLDIDTPDKEIWKEVWRMLDYYNIKSIDSYETPSGGLHILLSNKNNSNLYSFKKECKKFDNWKNMGKLATVHPNEDGKIILYSNVKTKGY